MEISARIARFDVIPLVILALGAALAGSWVPEGLQAGIPELISSIS